MIHIVAGNPHWCPWFLLPSETISVVCVAKINADVHDTCSLKESMLMSTFGLSMLLVAAMHREAAVQGYLCLQSQWEWDILKVSVPIYPCLPPTKRRNSAVMKMFKKILKIVVKIMKFTSAVLARWERIQFSFRSCPLEIWQGCNKYMGNTNLSTYFSLFLIFSFLFQGRMVRGWTCEEWKVNVINVHCMIFRNNKILCWGKLTYNYLFDILKWSVGILLTLNCL